MRIAPAALAVCSSFLAFAGNWPQYRGPQAAGVDSSQPVPVRWNVATGENIR